MIKIFGVSGMSAKNSSMLITDVEDEVLAISGKGISPDQTLTLLEDNDDVFSSSKVKIKDDAVPSESVIELENEIKELEQQKKEATTKDKADELQSKINEKKTRASQVSSKISKEITSNPDAKNFTAADKKLAIKKYDELSSKKYSEITDGIITESIDPNKSVEEQVKNANLRLGRRFNNPKASEALVKAKAERVIEEGDSSELRKWWENEKNKEMMSDAFFIAMPLALSKGNASLVDDALDIAGVKRSKSKYGIRGFNRLVRNYTKSIGNSKGTENEKLLSIAGKLGGNAIIDRTGGRYRRSSFSSMSRDAINVLGIGRDNKIYKAVGRASKKSKFDRKINEKLKGLGI